MHAASPTDGLKVPAAHASHAPPLGPEKPGLHAHDARDALPDAEVACEGQPEHVESPTDGLKSPAAHAWHAPPLGPEKPGLHTQDARDVLPDAEVACGGQSVQTSDLFAATVTENLPTAHAWHVADDEAPKAGENVPAPQLLQACTLCAAAVTENLPAAHAWHVADDGAPIVGENLPATQLVHTPPAAANLPAAQLVQLVSTSDPAPEDLPAAQSLHTAEDDAPIAGENFPAPQSLHAPLPTDCLKVPAPHAWHAPPLDPKKPCLHAQDARDALPDAEVEFGGQSVQILEAAKVE